MLKRKKLATLVILLVLPIILLAGVEKCHAAGSYFPQDYTLCGSTSCISGGISDLQSHDSAYMTFRSYASQVNSQILYAHKETVTIAGSSYYLSKLDLADASGMSLSAPMSSTGRKLWGKSVYPLESVNSIPASTWTVYYRTWYSSVSADNLTRSPSQIPQAFWSNAEYAYSSDNNYANCSMQMQNQEYSGYGINLPATAQITKVEVGYEAYTEVDEGIRISVSWDGGIKWSPFYSSPALGTVDPNFVSWADFTSATSWNSTTLADGNFFTRVAVENAGPSSNVFLDWLPVRVTYISPALAHSDVDLLIRKSDGSIRQTLATDVAQSAPLSTVAQTYSASYLWTEYAVVDSNDYLEIDYFVDVVGPNNQASAYLQVDDDTLVVADQTRVTDVILPTEQTIEVEFLGSSDTNPWSEITLSICTAWTEPNIAVSMQLYNYTAAAYATNGVGIITYVSNSVPNIEETKNRTIIENPLDFKDTSGSWKVKVKGIRNTTSRFDLKADLAALATKSDPVAAFSFLPEYPVSNKIVAFNATSSYDPDGMIASYLWVFGDGNTTSVDVATIEHTYKETGTYNVTLMVSDEDGFTATKTELLHVALNDVATSLPQEWIWLGAAIPLTLVPLGLLLLRRRKSNGRAKGFDFFNEITDGGIPDSFSVLLIGEAGSGKSVWCQELAYAFLKADKSCLYVTYNNPPNEMRRNMEKFHPDISSFKGKERLIFVDCYSSAARTESTEKYSLPRPFSLSDLGIVLTKATSEMGGGIRILLDSTEPLLAHINPSNVIDFLLDRTMRAKGSQSTFVLSVGKETIDAKLANRLEENVDCIIELDVYRNEKKTVRRMRVTKMSGRNPSDKWVQFRIDREKGITF